MDISRRYIPEREDRNEALNVAVDHCIEQGILSAFLRKNRAEVLGMLLEEFDAEKYERTLREEGIERTNKLTRILLEQNRIDDLKRATEDSAYQEQLFCEFGL